MADEEQTNRENDPGVVQDPPTNTPAPQEAPASHKQRNQWIAFGILALIMIGTVVVIGLLRPLIFGRIVPAVMGDFLPPETAVTDETMPEAQPIEAYPATEDAIDTTESETFIPAVSGAENETTSAEAPTSEETNETNTPPSDENSSPPPEPRTHTVQIGDNLTKISQQYGVPIPEIMAANNLTNPDYISAGQVLIIPTN